MTYLKQTNKRPAPIFLGIMLLSLLVSLVSAQTSDTLADYIQSGDRAAALEMIRIGAEVNQTQGDGTTPLHWAVYKVDAELVSSLLSREANPNAINAFGSTPLSEAVNIANAELVEMLLEAGAEPDAKNQDDQTALMLASRIGALDIVELLINYGADVNVIEEWRGQTAVMWAAANNFSEITEVLIDNGANVNVRSKVMDWGTQISSEPRNQYRPTAGLTALIYAARSGCIECIESILKAGADINLPDPDGVTPLIVAIDNYNYDAASFLLDEGAYPHSWDWWGRTALYVAVDMNSYGGGGFFGPVVVPDNDKTAQDIMRELLEAGVNPDPQLNMLRPNRGGNNGRFSDTYLDAGATPLFRAANSHDIEASRILLEYGALVDLPISSGMTPLMAAAGFGGARGLMGGRHGPDGQQKSLALVKVLLEAGADINAKITDESSFTSSLGRTGGAGKQGQTALFGAVQQAWMDVIDYLLEQGAQFDVVDEEGRNLLDSATATGGRRPPPNPELVAYLKIKFGVSE